MNRGSFLEIALGRLGAGAASANLLQSAQRAVAGLGGNPDRGRTPVELKSLGA